MYFWTSPGLTRGTELVADFEYEVEISRIFFAMIVYYLAAIIASEVTMSVIVYEREVLVDKLP